MQTLFKTIMQRPEVKEFMAEHPIHDAVFQAFEKHFDRGFTLDDLPFIEFTGKEKREKTIKNAA